MNNYNVPESAIDDLNSHTSSDDGVSDADVERVADFIEKRLFREKGKISKLAARAHQLFADRIGDAVEDFGDEDDGGISIIGRISIRDPNESGRQIYFISCGVILEIARDHFDEFADEARNLGWLK